MTDPTPSTGARRPKIEIYPYDTGEGTRLEFGFRLKAENGEVVTHGEGYSDPSDAGAMARKIIIEHGYDDARVLYLNLYDEVLHEAATAPIPRPPTLPEVWEDEDGGVWWAKGHHHPAAMALAVVASVAAIVGADEARDLVAPDVDELDAEAEGVSPGRHPERASELLSDVSHMWMRPDPNNPDERIVPAGPSDGQPWTRLELA